MTDLGRVAVLGFGTMGRGIAQVVAASGRDVTVLETAPERIEDGHAELDAFLAEGVRRDKVTEDERAAIRGRVHGTTELSALAGHDLVIEAIVEDHDVKAELWPQVAEAVGEDAILTTNTSALSVTDLAALVPSSERFAGLHFFNPAPLMPVVEIVRALQSSADVLARLETFCADIGKDGVVVADRPGFLVNRLLMPYLNDVVQAYDDGLASAEDIDTAVELGLGHRMGPLKMLDMIGLDVHHHATGSAYEQLLDRRFGPPPLLDRMVGAGFLGDKSGRGFRTGGGLEGGTTTSHGGTR
jgi:3-hydroxybutyryl-CoA dehydrogenase